MASERVKREAKVNIFVIVLNFNGKEDTIACVKSLMYVDGPEFRIVLVDNNSREASWEQLQERLSSYSGISLIRNSSNLGFAGGNNVGIRFALDQGAEYILLLNNDTVVEPQFLRELLAAFAPKVGIVGPKILYYERPDRIWSDGGVVNWMFFKGRSNRNKRDTTEFTDVREVDTVTGCALMIHREVIEKVGLLDERFFLYGEEDDWCYRATKAGFRVVVNPRSIVWHKVSRATGSEYNRTIVYYKTRNKIMFIRKHFPVKLWPTAFAWLAMTLCYRCIQALLRGRPGIITAIWKGLAWHLRNPVEKEAQAVCRPRSI